jgi:hypothetical protein
VVIRSDIPKQNDTEQRDGDDNISLGAIIKIAWLVWRCHGLPRSFRNF